MKQLLFALSCAFSLSLPAQQLREVARFSAPNATQAVAADSLHVYAISNSRIVRHRKSDGAVDGSYQGPFKHLNSGIILDGRLYCANTNYPETPMLSSLEIFDPQTLAHVGTHSFGIFAGSFTWIDRWQGDWYLMFVHYENYAQEAGKGVQHSMLVQMDSQFRQKAAWVLPKALVERLRPESISGGFFMPDGKLLLSPHHFEEVYLCSLPSYGYELIWEKTLPAPFQGQGICPDPFQPGLIWGIHREKREIISARIE